MSLQESDVREIPDSAETRPKAESPSTSLPPQNKSKYRYDWYQTASDVYLNIMIKGLKRDDVHVQFEDTMVHTLLYSYKYLLLIRIQL